MTATITTIDAPVPSCNAEGYPEPTAYQALKNIQRAKYGYRPLVYICSPFSCDVDANLQLTRAFCVHAVAKNTIPLAPHLYYPHHGP